jgi:hypothetical protein
MDCSRPNPHTDVIGANANIDVAQGSEKDSHQITLQPRGVFLPQERNPVSG